MAPAEHSPQSVLEFWFPDTGHENAPQTHKAFWEERMQGGMDAAIEERFSDLTLAAATGQLDHWATDPRGRLALLIALDQFPRSLWRDTPAAYAQDMKAATLALEGIRNGHFRELKPWEQTFFVISIQHCEGPDHLERMEALDPVIEDIAAGIQGPIRPMAGRIREQHELVKSIIRRFGRHPHRNAILGRPTTPQEEEYIATGDFPHLPREEMAEAGQPE